MLQTIAWTGSAVRLLDQTKLPTQTVYVDIANEKQMHDAIRRLVVRGAPAIGVAAAYGVYLGVKDFRGGDGALLNFMSRLNEVCDYLATSRPTAVNLFWAIEKMRRAARDAGRDSRGVEDAIAIDLIKARLLSACQELLEDDTRVCRAIGEHGVKLLEELAAAGKTRHGELNVLTHCNAGGLATVQYGTALAPIYVGAEKGMKFHVYADETRPLLQGSRITAYELQKNGIPVTVICDSMAATVMQGGDVAAVLVGTDRVAANGDVANKIGTLGVAILAKHFGIPFLVAAPTSSIDLSLKTGAEIPIEERDGREISQGLGGAATAPPNVDIYNPAFDVTPAELVTAIITERGVVRPPYEDGLRAAVRGPARGAGAQAVGEEVRAGAGPGATTTGEPPAQGEDPPGIH
jgi:methylthioribose-1-phosphate isomerase